MLLEVFLELSPDEFIIPKKPIHANNYPIGGYYIDFFAFLCYNKFV